MFLIKDDEGEVINDFQLTVDHASSKITYDDLINMHVSGKRRLVSLMEG